MLATISNSIIVQALSSWDDGKVYRYFAYGSNMYPTTMSALRQIKALDATAAVLPGYSVVFDGSMDSRIEPSAAFVIPNPNDSVHGVLYSLTARDFARVGQTEGVPLGYRWTRCQVYPYTGEDHDHSIGEDILKNATSESCCSVDACTLIPPNLDRVTPETFVPPSPSYLKILRDGAKYWKLDTSFQSKLAKLPTAKNLILPDGVSGMLLQAAETFGVTEQQ